jgi:acetylornithine deacetylase/succinyl-diaminopimelate desuccinylase-like protein
MRTLFLAAALLSGTAASAQLRPDQAAFRGLYKELIETNTTVSAGSCTLAAERMATRLKAAGFGDADIKLFNGPMDRPQDGGLVATLAGKDAKSKAILLLAHIDVVEAKRADWERDPFTLIEEGGWFYGRGTSDDKAQAAIFKPAVDTVTPGAAEVSVAAGGWSCPEHGEFMDAVSPKGRKYRKCTVCKQFEK